MACQKAMRVLFNVSMQGRFHAAITDAERFLRGPLAHSLSCAAAQGVEAHQHPWGMHALCEHPARLYITRPSCKGSAILPRPSFARLEGPSGIEGQ
jgi:hypothetical protein